jgi:NADPH:quinone reductase
MGQQRCRAQRNWPPPGHDRGVRAIQITENGGPDVLKVVDLPVPDAQPGEVVVEVGAAGVNYIDTYHRGGVYEVSLPLVLGLEGAGRVTAVGEGVTDVAVGDRVAWTNTPGSYAEHVAVPAEETVPVPDAIDDVSAVGALLQGMTAWILVNTTYPVQPGDDVLVHAAAGGVGLLLTQIARARGAVVIGTVSTQEKAALAREAGCEATILYTSQDFVAEVHRITGGERVHVVYDSVGKTTFNGSLDCLRPRGLLALFGQSSGPVPPFDPGILNQKGSLFLTRPTLAHYVATPAELRQRAGDVLGWIRDGSLTLRIDREVPLADAREAHRALEARETTGKVVLRT